MSTHPSTGLNGWVLPVLLFVLIAGAMAFLVLADPFGGGGSMPGDGSSAKSGHDEPVLTNPDPARAAAVLDAFAKAAGGKAAFDRIHNRVMKVMVELPPANSDGGVASAGPLRLHGTIYTAKPDREYAVLKAQDVGTFETGSNGDVVWEKSTVDGPRVVGGKERLAQLNDARFDRFIHWRDTFHTQEYVGVAKVALRDCDHVRVRRKGPPGIEATRPVHLFFDRETHLLAKVMHAAAGALPNILLCSGYKHVDGVRLPHRLEKRQAGQHSIIVLNSVKHNADIPDGRFDPPADVMALATKRKQ